MAATRSTVNRVHGWDLGLARGCATCASMRWSHGVDWDDRLRWRRGGVPRRQQRLRRHMGTNVPATMRHDEDREGLDLAKGGAAKTVTWMTPTDCYHSNRPRGWWQWSVLGGSGAAGSRGRRGEHNVERDEANLLAVIEHEKAHRCDKIWRGRLAATHGFSTSIR